MWLVLTSLATHVPYVNSSQEAGTDTLRQCHDSERCWECCLGYNLYVSAESHLASYTRSVRVSIVPRMSRRTYLRRISFFFFENALGIWLASKQ